MRFSFLVLRNELAIRAELPLKVILVAGQVDFSTIFQELSCLSTPER